MQKASRLARYRYISIRTVAINNYWLACVDRAISLSGQTTLFPHVPEAPRRWLDWYTDVDDLDRHASANIVRSFVRSEIMTNFCDQDVAKTIITLAHNLGLNAIAAGVETQQQIATLLDYGSDAFQGVGYLASRPMADGKFGRVLVLTIDGPDANGTVIATAHMLATHHGDAVTSH